MTKIQPTKPAASWTAAAPNESPEIVTIELPQTPENRKDWRSKPRPGLLHHPHAGAAPKAASSTPPAQPVPEAAPEPSPGAPEAAAASAAAADSPAPAAPEALDAAMLGAVGARDHGPTDATGPNVGPKRPSAGAVVSALRAVLPSARFCLGPRDTVRSALLVFASDGTVTKVQLMGATPEDDCIRAALAKAKVPPFLEPSFATHTTIRP